MSVETSSPRDLSAVQGLAASTSSHRGHGAARDADPLRMPALLLGFALGGFFDGILLHQILQWHHLLSGLDGEGWLDTRVQVLADGIFHALMYVVAVIGLWMLWARRAALTAAGASRVLASCLLIGFGSWHLVDAILSHWLLGIHRIRMDSGNPLVWDLAWLFAFGLAPLGLGMALRMRKGVGVSRGTIAGCLVAGLTLGAGIWAAQPPPDTSQVMVMFRPGTTQAQAFEAAAAVDARVVWSDRTGTLHAFEMPQPGRALSLYRNGALFVSSGLLPVACLDWSRV